MPYTSLQGPLFRKYVLHERPAKKLPKVITILKCWDLIDRTLFFHFHLQIRCTKHPKCIKTRPRPVLKEPGAGNYGLGTRGRKNK